MCIFIWLFIFVNLDLYLCTVHKIMYIVTFIFALKYTCPFIDLFISANERLSKHDLGGTLLSGRVYLALLTSRIKGNIERLSSMDFGLCASVCADPPAAV